MTSDQIFAAFSGVNGHWVATAAENKCLFVAFNVPGHYLTLSGTEVEVVRVFLRPCEAGYWGSGGDF